MSSRYEFNARPQAHYPITSIPLLALRRCSRIARTKCLLPLFWHSSKNPHNPFVVLLEALRIVLWCTGNRRNDSVRSRVVRGTEEFAAGAYGEGLERVAVGDRGWGRDDGSGKGQEGENGETHSDC
jgi:hypothetical protein